MNDNMKNNESVYILKIETYSVGNKTSFDVEVFKKFEDGRNELKRLSATWRELEEYQEGARIDDRTDDGDIASFFISDRMENARFATLSQMLIK